MNNDISRKQSYELGLKEGFKQGKIQGKKECADEMLKLGINIEIIKEVTKMNEQEILADYNS